MGPYEPTVELVCCGGGGGQVEVLLLIITLLQTQSLYQGLGFRGVVAGCIIAEVDRDYTGMPVLFSSSNSQTRKFLKSSAARCSG